MRKRQIDALVHLQFLRLKSQFRKIEKEPNAETIKPFRIGIKKLRALLRLLSLENPSSDGLNIPKALKKMHKSGGKVRDLELLQEKILETIQDHPGTPYNKTALLAPEKKDARKKEKEFLSLEEFTKAEKKIREHLPAVLRNRTIQVFFSNKLEEIRTIAHKSNPEDIDLHDIRKKLKDILYILKLYREDLNKKLGFRFWTEKELTQVKDLEEVLGNFNDRCNAISLITPDFLAKLKEPEKKLLLAVRRKLYTEKRLLKSQILHALEVINLSFSPSLSLPE